MATVDLRYLMSVGCDVKLKFKDGTMPASSVTLRMMSRVFSNALSSQKHKTPPKASRSASHSSPPGKTFVTMKGVSKQQWLRIAEFLYPVVPSPKIKDLAEDEYLLEVGKKFDLQLLLHKVDLYLESRVLDMETSKNTYTSSWGWFKRADRAGLTVCLPAIAKRICKQRKATCKSDKHLRSLSAAECLVLVKELAS